MSARPENIKIISDIVANWAMYDALKERIRQVSPTNPGIPQPGLCSSNNIPKNPNVVNNDATTRVG
jgi:hypothetical protein